MRAIDTRILSVLLAMWIVVGCLNATPPPPFPRRPIEQYPQVIRDDALTLAAEAVTDVSQQERYFGTNLSSDDVLPVFVLVANGSGGSSVLVDPRKMNLVGLPAGGTPSHDPRLGNETAETTLAVTSIALLSPALMVTAGVMIGRRINAQHHLQSQALRSDTLSPGESVHGIVYFTAPKPRPTDFGLRVELTDLGTHEAKAYVVRLSGGR